MGLPLYIAPVESDLRHKHSTIRNSPTHGNNRVGRSRRSAESLVESRRRAILNPNVTLAHINRLSDAQQEAFWGQQDHLTEARVRELREQQRDALEHGSAFRPHVRPTLSRESTVPPSEVPAAIQNMRHNRARARERLLASYLSRSRDQNQNQTRASSGLSREQSASASGPSGFDEQRQWYEHIVSRSRDQQSAIGADADGPASLIAAAISDGLDQQSALEADERYNHEIMAALGSRLARATAVSQSMDSPSSTSQTDGLLPQSRPRASSEHDGPDVDLNARARRAYRQASSLRRVTNASASSRRPTVGWSDSNDRANSRSRESSQSRIFGDISQIPTSSGRATPEAAAARRRAYRMGYLDLNGNRRLPRSERSGRDESTRSGRYGPQTDEDGNQLEDGYGVPVDPLDGLGDRRRSLSPEVSSWDTMLTTLTADPQLPSVGSSFASSTSALAAATAQGQPTVTQTPIVSALPAVPSPVTRGQDDDENGTNESTPAPILVEASGPMPSWFGEDRTGLTDSAPSGTTSAGTSQRIRSPFTVVSADADTADESPVMFNGLEDDAACEDSEMDDGVRRDGEEDTPYDEEEEHEAEEARAYLMGLSDHIPTTRRPGQTNPMERMFRFGNRDRPMRTGFSSAARSENNSTGATDSGNGTGNNSNNNTEESLDLLGIGGMQHIVRNLARREDIPDEWWAQAGLSRTLPRDESN